jgi:hypothetical protein
MTVTLSERWAAKVVQDGLARQLAERPGSRRAGEELMEPIRADLPPTVLRWSPSMPATCSFAACNLRVGS